MNHGQQLIPQTLWRAIAKQWTNKLFRWTSVNGTTRGLSCKLVHVLHRNRLHNKVRDRRKKEMGLAGSVDETNTGLLHTIEEKHLKGSEGNRTESKNGPE